MASASEILKQRKKQSSRKTVDISNLETLERIAQQSGYKLDENRPSLFRRTIDLISRPLYASAGATKALIKGENVAQEAWKGLKGEEKETYSDVLGELGVENKWLKGGLGLALDIALDPTTYFGGTVIKGVGKGIGFGAKQVGKAAMAVAPEVAGKLGEAGRLAKQGVTEAFSIYGGGKTKEIVDQASIQLNKISKTKEVAIDTVVEKFGRNVDPERLQEALKIAFNNRLIERGFKKGSYSYGKTKEMKELVESVKDMGQIIRKEAGYKAKTTAKGAKKIAGETDEWYIPGITEETAPKIGKSATPVSVGREGYKKEFKGKIKAEDLGKAHDIFARRFFEVVRDKMNRQFLTDLASSPYARKEAIDEFVVPIYEKGFKPLGLFKTKNAAGKEIVALGKAKKPIGYFKEADAKMLTNLIDPQMTVLDKLARGLKYDQFTNLFKTAVTAYFPAFHVRNAISGVIQNYQVLGVRALAPSNIMPALAILKKSDVELNLGKWRGTAKELGDVMEVRFGGASRYISDLGDHIEELAGNNFKVKKISTARKAGAFVEMNQKAQAVVTALKKGHTLEEALNLAEKAGFDYRKITQFESKIMKRLIPFYTFARKNAQLQLETLAKHPERILNQAKVANALSTAIGGKVTDNDIKGLPDWVLSGLGFKIKDNKYLSKFGLPLEEFIERVNKPLMSTLSSLNPLIKYPLESKLGYDFFRGEDIKDINKIAPATGELLMKAKANGTLPDFIDKTLNVKSYVYQGETKYSASPNALHMLRNMPTSRLQNTLEKIFNKDEDKVNKYLAFFSGGKIYDIDLEQQAYFKDRDLRRDLEDYLVGLGIGKKSEQYYIYKNELDN